MKIEFSISIHSNLLSADIEYAISTHLAKRKLLTRRKILLESTPFTCRYPLKQRHKSTKDRELRCMSLKHMFSSIFGINFHLIEVVSSWNIVASANGMENNKNLFMYRFKNVDFQFNAKAWYSSPLFHPHCPLPPLSKFRYICTCLFKWIKWRLDS